MILLCVVTANKYNNVDVFIKAKVGQGDSSAA